LKKANALEKQPLILVLCCQMCRYLLNIKLNIKGHRRWIQFTPIDYWYVWSCTADFYAFDVGVYTHIGMYKCMYIKRCGVVDIASASGMRRPEFESRHGKRFLGKHSSAVVYT
jgi:hypothetical protein